jgi:hypothetical protein
MCFNPHTWYSISEEFQSETSSSAKDPITTVTANPLSGTSFCSLPSPVADIYPCCEMSNAQSSSAKVSQLDKELKELKEQLKKHKQIARQKRDEQWNESKYYFYLKST